LERANPPFRVPGIKIPSPLCMRWRAAAVALSAQIFSLHAAPAIDGIRDAKPELVFGMKPSRELDLRGVSVLLGEATQGVRISCGRVRVVSKQVGKIRVGLIPELEVSEMQWEVCGRMPAITWGAMVQRFFEREPLLSESCFRGFVLVWSSAKNVRLEAPEARFDARNNCLQLDNTVLEVRGKRYSFDHGTLFLEESQAGNLVLDRVSGDRLDVSISSELSPPEIDRLIHKLQQDRLSNNE
jgi:hypothetical protein